MAIPVIRPEKLHSTQDIVGIYDKSLSPEWVAGFSTGESNFFITVIKYKTRNKEILSSVKLIPSLRFTISQNTRDSLLLKTLINFFGCGYITEYKKRSVCVFTVTRIDQVIKYVIPFFEKHPVIESKKN